MEWRSRVWLLICILYMMLFSWDKNTCNALSGTESWRDGYLGCFNVTCFAEVQSPTLNRTVKITPLACINQCQGYAFAGVQRRRRCLCGCQQPCEGVGNVSRNSCNLPCSGDRNVTCGGRKSADIYEVTLQRRRFCNGSSYNREATTQIASTTLTERRPPTREDFKSSMEATLKSAHETGTLRLESPSMISKIIVKEATATASHQDNSSSQESTRKTLTTSHHSTTETPRISFKTMLFVVLILTICLSMTLFLLLACCFHWLGQTCHRTRQARKNSTTNSLHQTCVTEPKDEDTCRYILSISDPNQHRNKTTPAEAASACDTSHQNANQAGLHERFRTLDETDRYSGYSSFESLDNNENTMQLSAKRTDEAGDDMDEETDYMNLSFVASRGAGEAVGDDDVLYSNFQQPNRANETASGGKRTTNELVRKLSSQPSYPESQGEDETYLVPTLSRSTSRQAASYL